MSNHVHRRANPDEIADRQMRNEGPVVYAIDPAVDPSRHPLVADACTEENARALADRINGRRRAPEQEPAGEPVAVPLTRAPGTGPPGGPAEVVMAPSSRPNPSSQRPHQAPW